MISGKLFFAWIVLCLLCLSSVVYLWYDHAQDKKLKYESVKLFEHLISQGTFKNVTVIVENESNGWCGRYINSNKTIIINRQENCNKPLKTLYHEYAHYIHFEILTNDEYAQYCEIYESSLEFPSVYAIETGCFEDFAESYAMYRLIPSRIDIKRYNYFGNLINEYSYLII